MVKEFKLSEKGSRALAFLKANYGEYTAAELAFQVDAEERGIAATLRPLITNNLVYTETREIPFLETDPSGAPIEVLKSMKTYAITQDGIDFVIE